MLTVMIVISLHCTHQLAVQGSLLQARQVMEVRQPAPLRTRTPPAHFILRNGNMAKSYPDGYDALCAVQGAAWGRHAACGDMRRLSRLTRCTSSYTANRSKKCPRHLWLL
jgi:hypothetical protein